MIITLSKHINKSVAPRLLSLSLRLHESLVSSSSIVSPNAFSPLPFVQRLVSIEVQDDYQRLLQQGSKNGGGAFDSFVDQAWNVLFEDRHRRLKSEMEREEEAEAEAQRLYETRKARRQRKRRGKRGGGILQSTSEDQIAHRELIESGEKRVQLLERYIRPALFNTSIINHLRHGSNQYYDNFVRWIRGEYLIAKYGLHVRHALKKHPELRDDAAGLSTIEVAAEKEGMLGDDVIVPLKLPSVNTVREAFNMDGWSRVKVEYSSWGEDTEGENPSGEGDNSGTSIEHIIHHDLHGQINYSGPINAYFEMRRREDSYELWTKDYIFGLAEYLLQRIADLDSRQENGAPNVETTILDVGAGDGRLVYFLRRAMREIQSRNRSAMPPLPLSSRGQSPLPTIIATDDGSWNAPLYNNNRHIRVERLSAVQALEKYGSRAAINQDNDKADNGITGKKRLIVLCSWMPPGEDWTLHFRAGDDVEEYILIGEADDGTCGHNWQTWGNPNYAPLGSDDMAGDNDVGGTSSRIDPPYAVDGYERFDLDDLSLLQFSRFDCERSSESKTVSFRCLTTAHQ